MTPTNGITHFLAFDLGAESGRGILGTIADGYIGLEELHRFPTEGLMLLGRRQWDVTRIYADLLKALRKCVEVRGPGLDGIGVDTWGVDFGLVASDGTILGNPTHYRDRRHLGAMEEAFALLGREAIYDATGIQFLPFNTAYQLYAMVRAQSPVLQAADSLLLMGDLLAYMLCGIRSCEYTNATTTQLVDPRTRTWNEGLIEKLGIPRRILLELTQPGSVLGPVLPEVAELTGIAPDVRVIAPATHDTGAAIAAVPATDKFGSWAYLSSGTWSLLGAELPAPLVSEESCRLNFTNEGGVGGRIRFLKNIVGLWLVQECRRAWAREGSEVSYAQMTEEAAAAEPFVTVIDVDDPRLMAPKDMPGTIRELARESGQSEPATRGALVRCVLESLALKYRRTMQELDYLLKRKTTRLHIIGGGVQNALLCQMTADACGIPVLAGPVEATALGNVVVQAMAAEVFETLEDARCAVSQSFKLKRYEPSTPQIWEEAAKRLVRVS